MWGSVPCCHFEREKYGSVEMPPKVSTHLIIKFNFILLTHSIFQPIIQSGSQQGYPGPRRSSSPWYGPSKKDLLVQELSDQQAHAQIFLIYCHKKNKCLLLPKWLGVESICYTFAYEPIHANHLQLFMLGLFPVMDHVILNQTSKYNFLSL